MEEADNFLRVEKRARPGKLCEFIPSVELRVYDSKYYPYIVIVIRSPSAKPIHDASPD